MSAPVSWLWNSSSSQQLLIRWSDHCWGVFLHFTPGSVGKQGQNVQSVFVHYVFKVFGLSSWFAIMWFFKIKSSHLSSHMTRVYGDFLSVTTLYFISFYSLVVVCIVSVHVAAEIHHSHHIFSQAVQDLKPSVDKQRSCLKNQELCLLPLFSVIGPIDLSLQDFG